MNQSCKLWPTPQPQQCRIQAASVTYTTVYSITNPLTHRLRPGVEPASSWILVRFFSFFLGRHPWHMEVPSLGVEWKLQLPAYTTATAMPDPSHTCDLHHSSWQHRIPDPPSEARDRAHILMDISWILNPLGHDGNSNMTFSISIHMAFPFIIKADV